MAINRKQPLDPKTFSLKNFVGEEVAIEPIEFRPAIVCKKGTADEYTAPAWKANVLVLTGPSAGRRASDTLLFGAAVVSRLNKAAGGEDLPLVVTPEWVESKNVNEDGSARVYLALQD